jgi:peptide subunit release factor 1 (eRF1)
MDSEEKQFIPQGIGGTMTRQRPRRVVVWIDHREAILVTFRGEQVTGEEELFSEVRPHTHGGGWAQHRIEAHRHEMLKHYYEEVIQHLGPVDEILILGPGQAKHELHHSIDHHKGLKGRVVAVRSTSRLTEQEVIAEGEEFFAPESQGSHA